MKCPLCSYRPRPALGPPRYVKNRKVDLMILHVRENHPELASVEDGCFFCGACGGGYVWASDLWNHWQAHGGLAMHLMEERLR